MLRELVERSHVPVADPLHITDIVERLAGADTALAEDFLDAVQQRDGFRPPSGLNMNRHIDKEHMSLQEGVLWGQLFGQVRNGPLQLRAGCASDGGSGAILPG